MTVPPINSAIILAPGDRFFVKEMALDPSVGAAAQVELALEESAPFPLAQLYHGYILSADRRLALGFAAYRRRFTEEELAAWPAASAVLPDILALIGPAPGGPLIVLQVQAGSLHGVAWDGRATLPVAVMAQAIPEPSEAHLAEMTDELRRRAGLGETEVRRLAGPAEVRREESGEAVFHIAGKETARWAAAAVTEADVRDKSFLEEKRRDDNRRRGWTRALLAAGALLLFAMGMELTSGAMGIWNNRRRATAAVQAADVSRIEIAQTVATRIEDLTARQERFFEWLAAVSAARPRSIQFQRVASHNDRTLVIDAQTTDAVAVGTYETALRQRADLEQVELRDLRLREGVTSFVVAVKFKPGNPAPVAGGGQP